MRYDLHCMEGNMTVQRSSLTWDKGENRMPKQWIPMWQRSGSIQKKDICFRVRTPLRVRRAQRTYSYTDLPLAEELRRWNEQYILPIGYKKQQFVYDELERGILWRTLLL